MNHRHFWGFVFGHKILLIVFNVRLLVLPVMGENFLCVVLFVIESHVICALRCVIVSP